MGLSWWEAGIAPKRAFHRDLAPVASKQQPTKNNCTLLSRAGGLCQSLGVQNLTSLLQRPTGGRAHQEGMCCKIPFPMETLEWQSNVFVCVCFYQCKGSEEALTASQGGKYSVLASSIQN